MKLAVHRAEYHATKDQLTFVHENVLHSTYTIKAVMRTSAVEATFQRQRLHL